MEKKKGKNVPDTVDIELTSTLALGFDAHNVIIFKKAEKGDHWRPAHFYYKEKGALLVKLAALGMYEDAWKHPALRSLPEDLRDYRNDRIANLKAS